MWIVRGFCSETWVQRTVVGWLMELLSPRSLRPWTRPSTVRWRAPRHYYVLRAEGFNAVDECRWAPLMDNLVLAEVVRE